MIIDGKAIAKEILARAKTRAAGLSHPPKVVAFSASQTGATRSYLAIKAKFAKEAGCEFEVRDLPVDTTIGDAIIVQLPLPGTSDTKTILDSIPLTKDADVLSSKAREIFEKAENGALLPPVVAAIAEICRAGGIDLAGKKAVVIGEGWLVGKPAAVWLAQQGAEVKVVTEKSENFAAALSAADIIVSGAGAPHLIQPEMIKDGVVLIDAGTSESDGALAGDADPACAEKCALFTPVPGGVGPIAVACLFDNVVTLSGV